MINVKIHLNPLIAEGDGGFIHHWMEIIMPVRDEVRMGASTHLDVDAQRALELAAIRVSLANLLTFPFVTERERAGKLQLHGAYFDIADGELQKLRADSGRFGTVDLAGDALAA